MLKSGVCCAVLLAALTVTASAGPDDFDRVVTFGDSLSDNGNIDAATFGVVPGPDYFFGRFSSGPTFAELLAGDADFENGESSQARFFGPLFVPNPGSVSGDVNLAVGGAQTTGGLIPSVSTQITLFNLVGGSIGPNDLVTTLAGANDIFNADLDPAAAIDAANAQTQNIETLVSLGARTIIVANLPNLGATPEFNGNAVTAQLGLDATNAFNAQFDTGIEDLAAANAQANLVQADLQSAFEVIVANPAAFGFTNVTDPCLVESGGGNTVCDNPDEFLFFDGVHPTGAGHALLAQYIAALLSTDELGRSVAVLGEVAVSTRLEASDILYRRGIPMMYGGATGGAYAEIIGQYGSGSSGGSAEDYDFQLAGIRIGFDARQDRLVFGGALAYLDGDVDAARLNADTSTIQADIYGIYHAEPFFIGAEGGVSLTDFDDIRRDTTFPTVFGESEIDSLSYNLAATLGTNFELSGVTLTPAVRVGYLSANVDAFSETAPILALQYSERNIEAGFWTARIRASTYLDDQRISAAFIEAGYEDLFSVDDGYTAKLVDNTAQSVDIDPDEVEARGLFLKAGVNAIIWEGAQLGAEYGVSFQDDDGEVHTGRVTLKIPLGGTQEALPLK